MPEIRTENEMLTSIETQLTLLRTTTMDTDFEVEVNWDQFVGVQEIWGCRVRRADDKRRGWRPIVRPIQQNNSDSTKVCVLCGAENPTALAENEAGDGYEPMCKRCWDDQTEAHPYG